MPRDAERIAKRRTRRFFRLYMRARDKDKAYEIYIKVAFGEIPYERALRELRELAREG